MDAQEQFEYYFQHPPKSLVEFVAQPVSLSEVVFDGHGYSGKYPDGLRECLDIVFNISCKCGGEKHSVVAESWDYDIEYHRDLIIAQRYHLKCLSCGKQWLLFDSRWHGYDAEIMWIEYFANEVSDRPNDIGDVKYVTYGCTNCGNSTFEIFARFEYSQDRLEEPDFADRPQDFFSWFTLVVKCSDCSKLSTAIECECA